MKNSYTRLNRVIGQLEGIKKMMDNEDDCHKIIVQFQAAKAALESAYSESLNQNLDTCLTHKDQEGIKKIIKLISKN